MTNNKADEDRFSPGLDAVAAKTELGESDPNVLPEEDSESSDEGSTRVDESTAELAASGRHDSDVGGGDAGVAETVPEESTRKAFPEEVSENSAEGSFLVEGQTAEMAASRGNDSDTRGDLVPPWIGFPPWGAASVGTGKQSSRKSHAGCGYRGVYEIMRKTMPSKTFESTQRIQRFSQQST